MRAPFFGTGAGSFVSAAGLGPIDTAHNTVFVDCGQRRAVALFWAAANCGGGDLVDHANPRTAQMGDGCDVAGLVHHFAGGYRGGKPHHMAVAGHVALAGRLGMEQPEDLLAASRIRPRAVNFRLPPG